MARESLTHDAKSAFELENNEEVKQILNSLGYFVPENSDPDTSSQVSSLLLVMSNMFKNFKTVPEEREG